MKRKNYLSYTKSKKFAISKKIKTEKQWKDYVKKNSLPEGIPKAPERVYSLRKASFRWGDFLGTGNSKDRKTFASLKETISYLKSENINSREKWFKHTKKKKFPRGVYPVDLCKFYQVPWSKIFGKKTKKR